jgi:LysM repeat protein
VSRAVGRVLAPFLALAFVVLAVSLLGGSDVVTGRVRPEAGAAPATTRTTTIFLSQPAAGSKDDESVGASGATTTSTSGEVTAGGTDTSVTASSWPAGSQAGSTDTTVAEDDAGPSADSGEEGSTYTVVAGDTPYSIAQAFGVSTQDLMDLNGIDDPYGLRIGTVLRIPAK